MGKTFEKSISCHQMPCIQGEVTRREHLILRSIMMERYIDKLDYIMTRKAGAFFQSGSEWGRYGGMVSDGKQWILIEFWCRDDQAIDEFITHVNSRLDDSTRSEKENQILDELLQYYEENGE